VVIIPGLLFYFVFLYIAFKKLALRLLYHQEGKETAFLYRYTFTMLTCLIVFGLTAENFQHPLYWFLLMVSTKNYCKLGPDQNILALMNEKSQQYWLPRIREIKVSIDNAAIPRDSNAGRIVNGNLIMHNGIKVEPLSYYNYGMLKLLKDNRIGCVLVFLFYVVFTGASHCSLRDGRARSNEFIWIVPT